MGWLRLVGSLKFKVSFAKEPYKRDDILQKRLITLRSLLIVATSYQCSTDHLPVFMYTHVIIAVYMCIHCVLPCENMYVSIHVYIHTHIITREHNSEATHKTASVPRTVSCIYTYVCLCYYMYRYAFIACFCVAYTYTLHTHYNTDAQEQSHTQDCQRSTEHWYGVASVSMLLQIIGLFYKRAL